MPKSDTPYVFVPFKEGPPVLSRDGLKAPRRDVLARLPDGTDASYSYYDWSLDGYREAPHE